MCLIDYGVEICLLSIPHISKLFQLMCSTVSLFLFLFLLRMLTCYRQTLCGLPYNLSWPLFIFFPSWLLWNCYLGSYYGFLFSENQRGVLGLVQIVTALLCVFDFVLLLLLLVCSVGMHVGEKEKTWASLFSSICCGTQMELFVRILMGNGLVLHATVILLWNAIKERTWDPQFSYIFWGSKQKGEKKLVLFCGF